MTTSNEPLNYEHAYIEMRNLLAYTLNVIASEVSDGVTTIACDGKGSEVNKKRQQEAYDIVCTQTHELHKSAHPINLEQHDELMKMFKHHLTFISDIESVSESFTDHHYELNKVRYLTIPI